VVYSRPSEWRFTRTGALMATAKLGTAYADTPGEAQPP
jgi:hypothetical protein